MKRAFEYDIIRLPSFPDLLDELREISYGYSQNMKLQIERKDLVKKRTGKSPDLADACSMLFYDYARAKKRIYRRMEAPVTKRVNYAW